ncbi:hypothetical protein TNCV_1475011 [Trichonephila clavipes]|nr:hypothetical protein TNCV_1475011 [Trichonephila clavipes]
MGGHFHALQLPLIGACHSFALGFPLYSPTPLVRAVNKPVRLIPSPKRLLVPGSQTCLGTLTLTVRLCLALPTLLSIQVVCVPDLWWEPNSKGLCSSKLPSYRAVIPKVVYPQIVKSPIFCERRIRWPPLPCKFKASLLSSSGRRARFLGGQTGVALQLQDARVGVGSTKKPTAVDVSEK